METVYFSKSNLGFYLGSLKEKYESTGSWPADLVEMTNEEILKFHRTATPTGHKLGSDVNGRPIWCMVEEPLKTDEEISNLREIAYANPTTGSDRFFVKALRLQYMNAPQEEVEAAIQMGRSRYLEIQKEYPYTDHE